MRKTIKIGKTVVMGIFFVCIFLFGLRGERIVLSGDEGRMLHNGPRNGDGEYTRYPRDDKRV